MELQGVAKELFWKIARKEIGDMAKWRHSKSKFLAGSQTFTLFVWWIWNRMIRIS